MSHYAAHMSMLTPPGMGGKYRIKGDRYPHMRRPRGRRRLVVTSIATVAALSVLGWGSLQLIDVFSGGSSASASGKKPDASACASPPAQDGRKSGGTAGGGKGGGKPSDHPDPDSITVNVLNATKKSGLAKSTSEELKKRGFKAGEVGNAPASLDRKVKKAGVLVGAPGSETSARLEVLATQLKGTDTKYDERKGKDLDLVIGDAFKKLTEKKAAEKALADLDKPEPSPSPTNCEK